MLWSPTLKQTSSLSEWSATLAMAATVFAATGAKAITVDTMVDEATGMVRLDFTELPPYEQIGLEGVTALYWCNCVDLENPSSPRGTGFTANAGNLEMQYEGAPPPSTTYIEYFLLDGYVLTGFELVDWIVVTQTDGEEIVLTAHRPLLEPVPEPSSALLGLASLATLCLVRMGLHDASHPSSITATQIPEGCAEYSGG